MLHQILFFIFAAVAVAAAINLLLQKHPINSALSLVVVMGALAVLYLLLGAEFVAAVQLIVYAGAIMVLFVFTIMLLNAGIEERTPGSTVATLIGVPGVAALIGLCVFVFARGRLGESGYTIGQFHASTQDIGRLLFQDYLLPFEVTSVLVLIGIMGAVVLAKRDDASPADRAPEITAEAPRPESQEPAERIHA
ncbi:MAG: NADH-quinone oxidoreductase subunit J [Terriglobales bacterium]|jgi:NADH-quinone oxidoreductase subunit J